MNFFQYLKTRLQVDHLAQVTRENIDGVADKELLENKLLVERILQYRSEDIPLSIQDERVFPGDQNFFDSGYYKTMLKRYFYAAAKYCKNKTVLDSCSGLGWGSYIISHYAKDVLAFDNNHDILDFCKKNWGKKNIRWQHADALNLASLKDQAFDVALAMETIEHFSAQDGERYLHQLVKKVKKGGILIGTSAFPYSTEEATVVCKRNPAHLHIFTMTEIEKILRQFSQDFVVVDQWMFIARL